MPLAALSGGAGVVPLVRSCTVLTLMALPPCAISAHEKQMLGTGSFDWGF